MLKKQFFLFIFDVILITCSILIAGEITHIKNLAIITHTGASLLTLAATITLFYISGLYDFRRLKHKNETIVRTIFCTILTNITVAAWFYLLGHWQFPVILFGIQLGISCVLLTAIRRLIPMLLSVIDKPNTILIGYGKSGREIHQIITNEVACILDDNEEELVNVNLPHGSCLEIEKHIKTLNSKKIILAISGQINDQIMLQLIRARLSGIYVTEMTTEYEKRTRKIPVHHIKDHWIALENGFSLYSHQYIQRVKRLTDISTAILGIILTFPVCVLTAIIIKIESRGPVIFSQKRVGYMDKEFALYKFRSMSKDAEKDGAKWAEKNDIRVTKFGKFIRKTRIDELPQFWNVLKGDMSLIGPRPEQPEFVRALELELPYYYIRHTIKPGLSGWAQINYPYGATIEDALHKLEYELYYIKNMSILLDLKIALKTIGVMVFGQGAR